MFPAGVAHLVERHLAKVEVASSSLVTRSIKPHLQSQVWFSFSQGGCAGMQQRFADQSGRMGGERSHPKRNFKNA